MCSRLSHCAPQRALTFEVFGGEEDRAEVVLLDEVLDVGSDRGAVEAHHGQLTQGSVAAYG